MSSEKTLIEYIENLKTELYNLNKRRLDIQIALSMAEEKCPFYKHEQAKDIEYDIQTKNFHNMSISEACCEFLKEQQKPCTTNEIIIGISVKAIRGKTENLPDSTIAALRILRRQNKILLIKKGLWSINNTINDNINDYKTLL